MGLDLRLPMGWLFTILGLLLVVYGVLNDGASNARSLGLNINLDWGGFLLLFGALMLLLAWRSGRAAQKDKK